MISTFFHCVWVFIEHIYFFAKLAWENKLITLLFLCMSFCLFSLVAYSEESGGAYWLFFNPKRK